MILHGHVAEGQTEAGVSRLQARPEPWRPEWEAFRADPLDAGKSSSGSIAALPLAVLALLCVLALTPGGRSGGQRVAGRMGNAFGLAIGHAHPGTAEPSVVYFGRKLEPRGHVVLHGAGQTDDASFREYSAAVSPSGPMLFMTYVDLTDDLPSFFSGLKGNLDTYPAYIVPQIGLSLNAGKAETHYEQQVATGALDERVAALCSGLKALDRPVYLRIGYEFNGQWNGYQPASYIAAFRRIALALRACSPETATVWDFAADGSNEDYMRFYPGDEFVDWWAINLFAEESLTAGDTHHFLADALAHKFPVMIGESTPRGHPVGEGQRVVDGWYRPYFELIRSNPQIKAFCYINWDWKIYPQWADWGDARVQDDSTVLAYYRHEMGDKLYQAAASQERTRALLGLSAHVPAAKGTPGS